MHDSSIVSRTSDSIGFSMNSMFGSLDRISAEELIVIDLLMPATLLIRSLSFVVFCFECAEIGFDVSQFLAVNAGSIVPGLAPALLICRRSGRTSSSVVWSFGRTLYYIGFVCEVFCKRLPPSCFGQDCARDFRVLHGGSRTLHTVVTN